MRPFTIQFPPDVEMVQFSACRDALWGLDHYGRVHIRTLSASCSTGMHWALLDLSQLGEITFFPLTIDLSVDHMLAKFKLLYCENTKPKNTKKNLRKIICICGIVFMKMKHPPFLLHVFVISIISSKTNMIIVILSFK